MPGKNLLDPFYTNGIKGASPLAQGRAFRSNTFASRVGKRISTSIPCALRTSIYSGLGIKFLRSVCFFGVLLFFNLVGYSPAFAQTVPNRDALASYKGGKYEEAVSICLEEIKDNPANLDSFVVAGWAFLRLGRFSDARDAALSGRKVNFYDPRLVETLGESCYFLGLNGEAKKYFEEYVNLAPQGAEIELVYYYMGEIFIREGRFRHADIAFTSALHHRPNSALWWSRLGYARERSGETTGAIRSYERALGLDSTLADAKRGMERLRAAVSR